LEILLWLKSNKAQKKDTKGFLLLELAICITIFSVIIISPLLYFPKFMDSITSTQIHYETYQTLNLARILAMATNEDTIIEADNNILNIFQNNILYKKLKAPAHFIFSISGNNKAGFKASGHSKYARTITIQSKFKTKKISVSVGNGKITMK
jgi:hypothetical protein